MKKIIALGASALLLVALAFNLYVPLAQAHAQILSCTPGIGETVAKAPDMVTCKTSEAMDPKGSSLSVVDATGMMVDKGDSKVDLNDPDRVTIAVSLDTAMVKDGVYTVKWKTLSAADNDSAEGAFQFAVGAQPVKIDPTGTPAPAEGEAQVTPFPEGTIKIVSPADKATVQAGPVQVMIALTGVELGDKYHWHIFLDNEMVTMITNKSDTGTVSVPAGEHDIKVTLADDAHTDLASATVHVTAQGTGAEATAAPTEAMDMGSETPTAAATEAMAMGTETPAATEAMAMGTETPAATEVMAMGSETPTAAATEVMAMGTETPAAAELTPTPVPTTLPTTGEDTNLSLYGMILVLGALILGAGAFVVVRSKR